jgi:hypothetical protein
MHFAARVRALPYRVQARHRKPAGRAPFCPAVAPSS